MNPKHLYYLILLTTGTGIKAATLAPPQFNVNATITRVDCDKDNKASDSSSSPARPGIKIISDGDIPDATNNNTQHVQIYPGKHVVISMAPCGSQGTWDSSSTQSSTSKINISKGALENPPDEQQQQPRQVPVIKQNIIPAGDPEKLTPDHERIQRRIAQQTQFDNLDAASLSGKVKKYIEFLALLRETGLNQKIKLPRIVFIGNDDEEKYRVIENLIGIKGSLTPDQNTSKLSPWFKAPIKFTLINDSTVTGIKIDGKPITDNLLKALKAHETLSKGDKDLLLAETPVNVEIRGPTVPTLVFIDLPWKAPESENKSANDPILSRLLHKYLAQPWDYTVAIGKADQAFSNWHILQLGRTFDPELRRLYTLGIDPPEANPDILSMALGLQKSYPAMSKKEMFYINQQSGGEVKNQVCETAANCGQDKLVTGLQRKLLQIWAAMRPDALTIIQAALDKLKTRLEGYEKYKQLKSDEEKFKGLMGQAAPILNSRLIYANEERDTSQCTSSPLDTIKESIFDSSPKMTPTSKANWTEIFAGYQKDISGLNTIPTTVDWSQVQSMIEELKANGPNGRLISELKKSVLKAQLNTLKETVTRLLETVQEKWKETIKTGLQGKVSLEAFPKFKESIQIEAEKLLKTQVKVISDLNQKLESADYSSGWTFDFTDGSKTTSLWIDLMKSDTSEKAFELFKRTAELGFAEICRSTATTQPRLIIDSLLTSEIVKNVIKTVEESQRANLAELTKLSSEAETKLTALRGIAVKYENLINFSV